jgi:hypothetical protein
MVGYEEELQAFLFDLTHEDTANQLGIATEHWRESDNNSRSRNGIAQEWQPDLGAQQRFVPGSECRDSSWRSPDITGEEAEEALHKSEKRVRSY